MIDPKKLIKGCISGNRECQRELYDLYAAKMFGVCIRYASDYSQAEDFLQEGFIKVFNNLNNLNDYSALEGWIRRIIINTCLEIIRKNKKHFDHVDVQGVDIKVDVDIIDYLSAEELIKIINKLPAGYKSVFNLYAVEGYSHKEIAGKLGISEGTSKSQYSRAKVQLQKEIENRNILERKIS